MEHGILWKSMIFALHIDLLEHNYIPLIIHYMSIFHKSVFYKDLFWSNFYFQSVLPLQLWFYYLLCILHFHILTTVQSLCFKSPTRVPYNTEYVLKLPFLYFKKKSYSLSLLTFLLVRRVWIFTLILHGKFYILLLIYNIGQFLYGVFYDWTTLKNCSHISKESGSQICYISI